MYLYSVPVTIYNNIIFHIYNHDNNIAMVVIKMLPLLFDAEHIVLASITPHCVDGFQGLQIVSIGH